VLALANPELGQKQICPNCLTKFYDLARRPAVCPKCHTAFDPEEAVKLRRVRTRAPDYESEEEKEEKVVEEVEGFEEEAAEVPEIDEGAEIEPLESEEELEEEGGATPGPSEDIGVEFVEEADLEEGGEDEVPFLEDEDEEDFGDDEIEGLPGEDDREA
jgi:uncharacterized protein (TIGR02300 family)